jgi:hypothetical protein
MLALFPMLMLTMHVVLFVEYELKNLYTMVLALSPILERKKKQNDLLFFLSSEHKPVTINDRAMHKIKTLLISSDSLVNTDCNIFESINFGT